MTTPIRLALRRAGNKTIELADGVLGVPSLPPHWQEQPADLTALKARLLSGKGKRGTLTAQAPGNKHGSRVGVHGMPGIGNSVLAMLLAHD
jgi:hypothetical protein